MAEKKIDLIIIFKMVTEINEKMNILLREKKRNKLEALEEEVVKKGWMDTNQVMKFFNCRRNYAIELLQRLGELPEFTFSPGSAKDQIRARAIYNKSYDVKRLESIKELFQDNVKIISLKNIMSAYGIELSKAKRLAKNFVEMYPTYKIVTPMDSPNIDTTILSDKEEDFIKIVDKTKINEDVT